MNNRIRILFICGAEMKRGGIEMFMMNTFRYIDHSRYRIDFLVHGYKKGVYDDEILTAGGRILHITEKSKRPIKYISELVNVFRAGEYDIAHSQVDAMNSLILMIAKYCGVKTRISHSHNTNHLTTNLIKLAINEVARKFSNKFATHRFACSNEAGQWMFGKSKFHIIKNAIDLNRFQFCARARGEIRNDLSYFSSNKVIGHVGRFDTQKNHTFIIELFKKLYNQDDEYRLMLIGDGWLRKNIENRVEEYGLREVVSFIGSVENVYEYYSAMDYFILPSLFEGLGIVLLEAQCNGLICIASDQVPKDVSANTSVEFLPLDVDLWISLFKQYPLDTQRIDMRCELEKKGYNIYKEINRLENLYTEALIRS